MPDRDICRDVPARTLVDVLENIGGNRRVVLEYTAGRQKGTGRMRVLRCVARDDGAILLTVAREGKGGEGTGTQADLATGRARRRVPAAGGCSSDGF